MPKNKICLIRATFKNKKLSTQVRYNFVLIFGTKYLLN